MQKVLTSLSLALLLLIPSAGRAQDASTPETAVRQILADQQDAWNHGDIDAFMAGYWRSDSLRFASGGSVQHGWQQTLERYHKSYPDRDAMGTLTFTLYSVDLLSDDYAFVFGRYELERSKDHPTGLFTLLFRRFDEGWRIVFDHTSSDTFGTEE
ncbi:MAG: nuclear transport factor 2 family protein [Rhodothermales bacterium]